MTRPVSFDRSIHDFPPIILDADQVVVIGWVGADYNFVRVGFSGGSQMDLRPDELGLDLAGQLASPEQAEWCVDQVRKVIWG